MKRVYAFFCKGVDILVDSSASLVGGLLLFNALITGYEVIARHFFNSPTIWTLEITCYVNIVFGFVVLGFVQKSSRHIAVDLITSKLSGNTRLVWDMFIMIIVFVYACLFTYLTYDFFMEALEAKEVSNSLVAFPIWIPRAGLFVGGLLISLQLIKDIISNAGTIMNMRVGGLFRVSKEMILFCAISLSCIICTVLLCLVSPFTGLIAMILALLLGGVPIFAALGSVGVLGIYLVYGGMPALSAIPNVAYGSLDSFSLACLPLFILTGHILAECGVGQELFDMCSKWTRGLPGGSAIATILACMVFAAISTSSVATATTIGLIALPELARRGYNKNFSYGALAAGGTLGIMIPPSGSMIIYSAVTEESLGRLFMAGIIPGIILGIFFSIYCTIYCKSTGQYEKMERVSWQEKVSSLKTGVWGLITPGIIMGGIYSGIFTPLETGGMAALYSICVAMARRKLRGRDIITLLRAAAISTGMLFAIITGALIMGVYVTYLQVPQLVINLITDLDIPNWNVIAMLMGLYIFLGLFLEVVSAMMITLPIVYPLIITLGCDGIWFAVLITLNMEMALITPPVGLNLFVIQGIAKAPLYPVIRGVTPFFLLMCVGLLIVAFFPGLSTWLPSVMVK